MIFRHSGKLGDIVYSLPAVKSCQKSILYLNTAGSFGFTTDQANALLPLLRSQSYIEKAKIWEGEPFDIDFDEFRIAAMSGVTNLADCHLKVLDLSSSWRNERWIELKDPQIARIPIIFARTSRYPGVAGFWPECLKQFGAYANFVGTSSEHFDFCNLYGYIPHFKTDNLLQLATAINSAFLFIGNQSCPMAVAQGLKMNVIQESYSVANCVFERKNALHVRNPADIQFIAPFGATFLTSAMSYIDPPE